MWYDFGILIFALIIFKGTQEDFAVLDLCGKVR